MVNFLYFVFLYCLFYYSYISEHHSFSLSHTHGWPQLGKKKNTYDTRLYPWSNDDDDDDVDNGVGIFNLMTCCCCSIYFGIFFSPIFLIIIIHYMFEIKNFKPNWCLFGCLEQNTKTDKNCIFKHPGKKKRKWKQVFHHHHRHWPKAN